MTQCDVFYNEAPESRDDVPYLLDLQSGVLDELQTCVVAPLYREAAFRGRIPRLHPDFEIDGDRLIMATHLVAAVRRSELRRFKTTLLEHRYTIIRALDVIVSGV